MSGFAGRHWCGDCRKEIIDACARDLHLRIAEEQQRAERAERHVQELEEDVAWRDKRMRWYDEEVVRMRRR